jgi:hypothetical protein
MEALITGSNVESSVSSALRLGRIARNTFEKSRRQRHFEYASGLPIHLSRFKRRFHLGVRGIAPRVRTKGSRASNETTRDWVAPLSILAREFVHDRHLPSQSKGLSCYLDRWWGLSPLIFSVPDSPEHVIDQILRIAFLNHLGF